MAGGKETPRQKMIGMMYLVLTAMLALNVSTAVLKSFLIVNDSIRNTNENFEKKVNSIYAIFEQAWMENKDKMQTNYDKALKAKELTEEFRNYLEDLQTTLKATAERVPYEDAKKITAHDIKRQDDYDTPTMIFIEQGKGKALREKIDEFEKAMLDLIPEDKQDQIKSAFNTIGPFHDNSGKELTWEQANFYQSIIVAAITILNKLENDAMNLEYDVTNLLFSLVSADDFKFDNIVARIVPKSTYVMLGDPFEAEVFIVAFDSKAKTSAVVNGQHLNSKDGIVSYVTQTSREGVFPVSGQISLPGDPKTYPFKTEYVVARPSATVSADAMNVFYIGVDNPVSIAAAGVDAGSTLVPSISNGTIVRNAANDGWVVRVTNASSEAVVSLTLKTNRAEKHLGSFKYRVKRVPDPLAVVPGIDESQSIVDKTILAGAGGLIAKMKDFDFKLDPRINSFSMSTTQGGDFREFKSTSNRFTDEMVNVIRNSRKGQKFFFESIMCQMPTGQVELRSIVFTIR